MEFPKQIIVIPLAFTAITGLASEYSREEYYLGVKNREIQQLQTQIVQSSRVSYYRQSERTFVFEKGDMLRAELGGYDTSAFAILHDTDGATTLRILMQDTV